MRGGRSCCVVVGDNKPLRMKRFSKFLTRSRRVRIIVFILRFQMKQQLMELLRATWTLFFIFSCKSCENSSVQEG